MFSLECAVIPHQWRKSERYISNTNKKERKNDGFVRERENAQGELFTFVFYDDDTDILLTN